jgi:hypothetical protein
MPLTCKWKTTCASCGDAIEEGDRIVLTGEKEKLCYDCAENVLVLYVHVAGINVLTTQHVMPVNKK